MTRQVPYNGFRNISLIRALDQNTNRTGGIASIIAGGVNQRNVTLQIRASAVGRPIDFIVQIYAV